VGPHKRRRLERKAIALHWELMFTRAIYQTPDVIAQHRILEDVAALVDAGVLGTTPGEQPAAASFQPRFSFAR
jgi:hypothetical protein